MKKAPLLILILFLIISCKEFANEKSTIEHEILQLEKAKEVQEKQASIELPEFKFDVNDHLIKYDKLKKSIAAKRSEIANQPNTTSEEKHRLAERYVSAILIDSVFEYWEGTKWDFNGYTETPRKGVVACGYYVSTTLKHIGLKINRYKVAQKAAADIIKDLCQENSIKTLNGFTDTKAYLQDLDDNEIVIVGLDFHVGFVYKQNNALYFAHSNYIDSKGVMKELLDDSDAFKNSDNYVVGKLTKNSKFLAKWLSNK